ncbi:MAG: class I SAM-dependent methyltransferase [Ignavibacteriota bacterium]|nr:class I SAM-dependent methyltransferase [Ignavibacteriota bacterium]
MKNNQFYDDLSSDYDSMLNFEKLVTNRTKALSKFIKSEYKCAIDIGCGTGADSIALTNNGLSVTGYDTSLKMIQKAKLNAKERSLKIRFSDSLVQSISSINHSKYDLVVSLGNAVANIHPVILKKIFRKVYKLLRPGGSFIIQILNYNSIRKTNKRIVNITRGKESLFIRFYDFEKNKLNFNVLKVNDNDFHDYNLITTELYEHKGNELKTLLSRAGFSGIKLYSDLNKSKFNSRLSKDLILTAVKLN